MVAVSDPGVVDSAVEAARLALPGWRRLPVERRLEALSRLQAALPRHVERIASAITAEMGKILSESVAEAQSIGARVSAVASLLPQVLPGAPPGAPGEQRFHALGVTAVVGPFNYPIHLVNTYAIPALLTGNTVVAKASEVTPLAAQRYAELFEEAGLPDGVFNLVQGTGPVGAALVAHPHVRSVVFTGSYHTGRLIREATFDQPYKKVSLELGGKYPAVVLDDAHLEQAAREILLGALLTTGQRCTATTRVIAAPGIAPALRERLVEGLRAVRPGDPLDPGSFMGPLATRASRDRYLRLLRAAREEGARVLLESEVPEGEGAFVTPSLYEIDHPVRLLHEEAFGPNLVFEVAASEDEAILRAASGTYGLSASLFSASHEQLERFYEDVPAGIVNWNRSTNGASGALPFGGVGQSGNFRSGGSLSPRMCTYPVAMMQAPYGEVTPNPVLERALSSAGGAP
jgi:succinylglutamic semialdehyde dehydrogenase